MKKQLRIGFIDTFESFAQFMIGILSKEYDITRDDENPEYLFFGDENFGNRNQLAKYQNCVRIFYTGENRRAANYKCDYAITFDHDDTETHYRLPLYVLYDHDNEKRETYSAKTRAKHRLDHRENVEKKFCSFVVKNPNCLMRNSFFHKLSEYKKVDSGGPLFNNIGYTLPGGDQAVQRKYEFLDEYKFNLCFENSSYPGYVTEKLYDALICNTVPIYWGSPTIEVDFNPNAFLNWHDFQDDKLLLEAIIELDNNERLYYDYFYQPMFREGRMYNKFFDTNRLLKWFAKNVFRENGNIGKYNGPQIITYNTNWN